MRPPLKADSGIPNQLMRVGGPTAPHKKSAFKSLSASIYSFHLAAHNLVRHIDFRELMQRKKKMRGFELMKGPPVYSKYTPPIESDSDDEASREADLMTEGEKVYLPGSKPNEYIHYRELFIVF